MKKAILLAAACLWLLNAAAQTGDAVLNRCLGEFLQLTRQMDAESMMDYLYPRIFEKTPREKLVSLMKSVMQQVTMSVDTIRLLQAAKITVDAGTAFTRFRHYTVMRMQFPRKEGAEDEAAMYLMMLKAQFGKENVSYNGENNTFTIRQTKYTLAIKDSYSKNKWTFLSQEQSKSLNKLLPAALVKKYKM